jgi:hypothetical protein
MSRARVQQTLKVAENGDGVQQRSSKVENLATIYGGAATKQFLKY